jgi:hypothetical protein
MYYIKSFLWPRDHTCIASCMFILHMFVSTVWCDTLVLLTLNVYHVHYYFFQVVSGALVRLTLELGYTSCRKGVSGDVSNCELKEDSVIIDFID